MKFLLVIFAISLAVTASAAEKAKKVGEVDCNYWVTDFAVCDQMGPLCTGVPVLNTQFRTDLLLDECDNNECDGSPYATNQVFEFPKASSKIEISSDYDLVVTIKQGKLSSQTQVEPRPGETVATRLVQYDGEVTGYYHEVYCFITQDK